jgi:hypothetical protein
MELVTGREDLTRRSTRRPINHSLEHRKSFCLVTVAHYLDGSDDHIARPALLSDEPHRLIERCAADTLKPGLPGALPLIPHRAGRRKNLSVRTTVEPNRVPP